MRGYKIEMSSGTEIKIDQDEVEKIMMAIDKKIPVLLRQGLVNPSFVVAVTPDKDRVSKLYDDGSVAEIEPLTNYFDTTKLLQKSGGVRGLNELTSK